MCLYPRLIKNRKYGPTKKNGGRWPVATDPRTHIIPIGCGECMECRKQKSREWQARLLEDVKTHKNGIFITLTFSNKSLAKICKHKKVKGYTGYNKDNAIAKRAVRAFLERWRKTYKVSLRHWLITELGHQGTENIHLHGIVWTNEKKEQIRKHWKYGYCWIGKEQPDGSLSNYVSTRTINYCIKYVYKRDIQHKYFKARILTSPGIGKNYTETLNAQRNKYNEIRTSEAYITETGHKISLPKYWRNKIYTDEEREKLWIEKLDKQIRYVNGIEIDISNGEDEYYKILKREQEKNRRLGYGDGETKWEQKEYEEQRRQLMINKRLQKEMGDLVTGQTDLHQVPF